MSSLFWESADPTALLVNALRDVDDIIQGQLKELILDKMHEVIDPELDRMAEQTARSVVSKYIEYYKDPRDFSATIQHLIEVRRSK